MHLDCQLAAMDGMSHAAFRSVCFEYGADGATTEMVSAVSYGRAREKKLRSFDSLLTRRPEEKKLAAQIVGCEASSMAEAARRLERLKRFDAIEINMGCPARTVVGSGNGSALLQNVPLAGEILRAVCGAVQLPVRLKMRLGWDEDHITAPEIAALAQEAGCSAIILHGRTRMQMYRGNVNIAAMRAVADAVSLPVLANGGITCAADAARFAADTHARSVVIGRAALKAPWIFEDIRAIENGEPVRQRDAEERIGVLLRLAERNLPLKPEKFAILEMRKFSGWYLPGLAGAESVLSEINAGCESYERYRRILSEYLDALIRGNDTYIHPELMPEPTLDTVNHPKLRRRIILNERMPSGK